MRIRYFVFSLLALLLVSGCALGKKEWPAARESDDAFELEVIAAQRKDQCLTLQVGVRGAVNRLYRVSIQLERVGGEGGGCPGCPFVPREAVHITRDQQEFSLKGNFLDLSLCTLEPGVPYRFRVAGKSELPTAPLVYTDVFVADP
ncbi:hypothetical protein [Pseudodesulfovibrio cashew]|uniref:hypothetical protein n=1 Tax=Pseudodesulfovibrio cashew TaxID=2678688 RepID=UPI001F553975|nr:hypothetical protein [Pseudodesulfovibrio cashew]